MEERFVSATGVLLILYVSWENVPFDEKGEEEEVHVSVTINLLMLLPLPIFLYSIHPWSVSGAVPFHSCELFGDPRSH